MVQKTEKRSLPTVNTQITDAVTQSNVMALGIAPAQSIAALYQTSAQAAGTAMQNSVANQQNLYSVNLAALTQNLQALMTNNTALVAKSSLADGRQSSRINAEILGLLSDLVAHNNRNKHQSTSENANMRASEAS